MIDQIWFLFSNVIISGEGLVKILLKEVKLMDSVVLLYDKNEKVPKYLTF